VWPGSPGRRGTGRTCTRCCRGPGGGPAGALPGRWFPAAPSRCSGALRPVPGRPPFEHGAGGRLVRADRIRPARERHLIVPGDDHDVGLAQVTPPHPRRDPLRDPLRGSRVQGADQGNRQVPERLRPEPAPCPQVQVPEHVPARRAEGHRHPDRAGRHHTREHARLTSRNTGTTVPELSQNPAKHPAGPWRPTRHRHGTPATGMPRQQELRNVTEKRTTHQSPNP